MFRFLDKKSNILLLLYEEKNLINKVLVGGMEIMRRHDARVIIAQVEAP